MIDDTGTWMLYNIPFIVVDATVTNCDRDRAIIVWSNETASLRQSTFQCDI